MKYTTKVMELLIKQRCVQVEIGVGNLQNKHSEIPFYDHEGIGMTRCQLIQGVKELLG